MRDSHKKRSGDRRNQPRVLMHLGIVGVVSAITLAPAATADPTPSPAVPGLDSAEVIVTPVAPIPVPGTAPVLPAPVDAGPAPAVPVAPVPDASVPAPPATPPVGVSDSSTPAVDPAQAPGDTTPAVGSPAQGGGGVPPASSEAPGTTPPALNTPSAQTDGTLPSGPQGQTTQLPAGVLPDNSSEGTRQGGRGGDGPRSGQNPQGPGGPSGGQGGSQGPQGPGSGPQPGAGNGGQPQQPGNGGPSGPQPGGPQGPGQPGGSGSGGPGGPQQPGSGNGGSQGPQHPGNGNDGPRGPQGPGQSDGHHDGPPRGGGHDGPPTHIPKPPRPSIPPSAPIDYRPPWQMPLPPPSTWHNPWSGGGSSFSLGLSFEHTSIGPTWYNSTSVDLYLTVYENGDVNRPCGTVVVPPGHRRGYDGFNLRDGANYAWASASLSIVSAPGLNQYDFQGSGGFNHGGTQLSGSISVSITEWNGYQPIQFDDYAYGDGYIVVQVPVEETVVPLYVYGSEQNGVWTPNPTNAYSTVPTNVPSQRVDKPPFQVTVDGGVPGSNIFRDNPVLAGIGGVLVAILGSVAGWAGFRARRLRRQEDRSHPDESVSPVGM